MATTMNALTPFLFESHVAHGAIVQVHEGVGAMLGHRDYSPDVARLIGEAMAAMPLLATHMRFEGRINLQFRGEGAMKLLVTQIDHELNVRGMAQAPPGHAGSFEQMLRGGLLALMLEPSGGTRPASQAVVLIQGERLEQALEAYFAQSEQLPTRLRLVAAPDGRIAGFLLQRMPKAQDADEEWTRLQLLAATLTDAELLAAEPLPLIGKLFAAEAVRVFAPRPVTVRCRCNRDGIGRLILSLGRQEADDLLAEQGEIGVTCEFCGQRYVFAPREVEQLFDGVPPAPSTRTH